MTSIKVKQIDDLLPQIQCGQCNYSGCLPYAEAIADKKASIDACLPGGIDTLIALAKACGENADSYLPMMQKKMSPWKTAVIREESCIGCTKCIQACPTDAIIGAAKQMHTIITDACTGCGLCLAPCPVDCIDLKPLPETNQIEKKRKADYWRSRHQLKQQRITAEKIARKTQEKLAIAERRQETLEARRAVIQAALKRDQKKRQEVPLFRPKIIAAN